MSNRLNWSCMKRTLSLPLLTFFVLTASAYATDVRIMDSAGVEVLVKDISIDYGGLLGSDKDTEGIRVTVGDALVTARWADIQSVTVTGRDAAAGRITIEILLKSGKVQAAQLQRKGRMKIAGKADLGEYSIDLEKIKKVTVVSVK